MIKKKVLIEYNNKKKHYKELVNALRPLLEIILDNGKIKFQIVQGPRLKKESSLIKNFKNDLYKKKKINNIEDIPDIVGCRVIFYSIEELEKFKRAINDEFSDVNVKNKMNDEGYKGYNIACKLGDKRRVLSEYANIANLKFEIQLTTVFYHGWNEWEHDIFYKDELKVEDNFPDQFEKLKTLSKKSSDKLRKIQNEWEYIDSQYKNIAKGGFFISLNTFDEILKLNNNNEIYTTLNNLSNSIEEIGGFPADFDIKTVFDKLFLIIKKSSKNKIVDDKTFFGVFEGKAMDDIIESSLKIFSQAIYKNVDDVVDQVVKIYLISSDLSKNKIENFLKDISRYRFNPIKKQIRYDVQFYFIDLINKWLKKRDKDKFYALILSIAESLLNPNFHTTSSDDSIKVSFINGSLDNNKFVRDIRNEIVSILLSLYKSVDLEKKLKMLDIFELAMRKSDNAGKVDEIIKDNIAVISKFYYDLYEDLSVKELSKIESDLIWVKKRSSNQKFPDIDSFFDLLSKDEEFNRYKVFVGYEYWDKSEKAYDSKFIGENEKARDDKVKEYCSEVNEKNISKWKKIIYNLHKEMVNCEDISKYRYFDNFLREIGKNRQELALQLINNSRFRIFKESVINGAFLSKDRKYREKVKKIVDKFVEDGLNLHAIAMAYSISGKYTKKDLIKIVKAASIKKRKAIKINVLWEIIRITSFENKYKSLIWEIIKIFNSIKYYNWINNYYSIGNKKDILDNLTKKELSIIKKTLIDVDKIDYHEEQILEKIVVKYPKEFVKIFEERIIKKQKKSKKDYEDIPHRMNYLEKDTNGFLNKNKEKIIDEIFMWSDHEYNWFMGILLKAIYPEDNDYLQKKFNEVIDLNDKDEWKKYINSYMRWNQGFSNENLVKRTIKKLNKDDEIWDFCRGYLLIPGTLVGSINDSIEGDAYREMLKKVKDWKTNNKKLKEFKGHCIEDLEFRIKESDFRHRGTLENMKRKY